MKKTHNEAFVHLVNESRLKINEVDIHQARQMCVTRPELVFIDVREDREFEVDACAGAVHIGKGVIERDIHNLVPDTSTEIILYCGGGFRSALAAEALQKMGYSKVWSMDGGIRAWRNAHLPMN